MNHFHLLVAQGASAAGDAPEERWIIIGLVLLALGIVFFAAEIFVPSGGLLALLCGLSLLGSIGAFTAHDWRWGLVAAAIYAAGAPAAIIFGLKVWSTTPLARRMILDDDVDGDRPPPQLAAAQRREQLRRLVGAEGIAITPLRPVGFVRIQGERIDALAETALIEAGTRVVVVDVLDDQIKVRAT